MVESLSQMSTGTPGPQQSPPTRPVTPPAPPVATPASPRTPTRGNGGNDDMEMANTSSELLQNENTTANSSFTSQQTQNIGLTGPTGNQTANGALSGLPVPQTPPRPYKTSGRTPSTPIGRLAASVYLSSPIRRPKHNVFAGTMTPGRPSIKPKSAGLPFSGSHLAPSPMRATRPPGGGSVELSAGEILPSMPLQTLLMTAEQAREVDSLERARELLVLAIEQSERFRLAAQQYRSQANHYAFQHRLVQIERDEGEQRYEVETNIQQKEIEKLVMDIMGYSGKSVDTEQIRRRLKKTKQRLQEMEEMLNVRDYQLKDLRAQIYTMHEEAVRHGHPPQYPIRSGGNSSQSSQNGKSAGSPIHGEKPRPPPINTQLAAEQSSNEPLSALEVLASQVLSSGIKRPNSADSTTPAPNNAHPPLALPSLPTASAHTASPRSAPHNAPTGQYQPVYTSPYHSPFYTPFSPYAVPSQVRPAPTSVPQFGSPEKRRRQSSTSTISAMSEDDTLEEQFD